MYICSIQKEIKIMKNENRLSEIRRAIKNGSYTSDNELTNLIMERDSIINSLSGSKEKNSTELISLLNQYTF